MARKTIEVGRILAMVNTHLAHEGSTDQGREAVISIMEQILFQSGNYKGYAYLPTKEVLGKGTRRRYLVAPDVEDDYVDQIFDQNS